MCAVLAVDAARPGYDGEAGIAHRVVAIRGRFNERALVRARERVELGDDRRVLDAQLEPFVGGGQAPELVQVGVEPFLQNLAWRRGSRGRSWSSRSDSPALMAWPGLKMTFRSFGLTLALVPRLMRRAASMNAL